MSVMNEVSVLVDVISELTGFGLWVAGGYAIFKLISMVFVWGGFFYLANKIIVGVFSFMKTDVTRAEVNKVIDENSALKSRVNDAECEMQKLKAAYLLLRPQSDDKKKGAAKK